MTPEEIQALRETATGGDQAAFEEAVMKLARAEVDRSRGVEDVTAGLTSTLEKQKRELEARKAELEQWAELGPDRDAIRMQLEEAKAAKAEAEKLRAAQEEAETKARAEAAGGNPVEIERLVAERAQAAMAESRQAWEERIKASDQAVERVNVELQALTEKLFDTALRHELYKAAPDADPTLFRFFTEEVKPHVRPRVADGSPAEDWWKQDRITLEVIDPQTKTALQDGEKALGLDGLVGRKRQADWSAFFRPTGKGGGMNSGAPTKSDKRLPWNAPPAQFLNGVLS
jgi:hypothetical protein